MADLLIEPLGRGRSSPGLTHTEATEVMQIATVVIKGVLIGTVCVSHISIIK